jgi:UPF0755 protein
MRTFVKIVALLLPIMLTVTGAAYVFFGPPQTLEKIEVFTVPQKSDGFDVTTALSEQKLIKNEAAFRLLFNILAKDKKVAPGGYYLSPNMNAWQVLTKITGKPDLAWVTVSYCLRKEQTGEILAETLGWDSTKLQEWNMLYSDTNSDYFEGVYYPDTYLIPVNAKPEEIASRFIARFNEKFAPLADQFLAKNIKWTTGLKIASLIAREAAGSEDAKLISGIIWNRLEAGMPLQIDATLQYTLGKNSAGRWWGTIDLSQKENDSPYNSYLHKGLPPTPICSPNVDMIEAVLNPETTDCLFYLHDASGQIHCAKTYQEHLTNIKKYLD